jgi:hypothetical protein
MPGVPRELIEHELHLDLKAKPVKQQLCHFTQDKIARLLDVRFIKEVYRPNWLTNPFLVPKKIKIGGCMLIILILIRHAKRSLRTSLDRSGCGLHS